MSIASGFLKTCWIPAFAGMLLLCAWTAAVAAPFEKGNDAPVNFQARQLSHDDEKQTVTAIGDVELVQGGKILRADKMVYNLETDTVAAIGNVSLLDEDGSVHFAEYVELTKNMREGFVHHLLSMLADGSRFTAAEAKREEGVRTTMTEATYTPCKVCEADPKPVWQLKADKVVHDEAAKTVRYKNARLELMGVPLAYTPVFSHADPSVKRKSGFLRPRYGWSSDTGGFVEGGYYFGNIAPDKDATLQIRPTLERGTLVMGQWRQRFEQGRLQIDASGVRSDREEEDGRVEADRKRGHIFAKGDFDIDRNWRAGFDLRRTTDKEYLRLYDISKEDVLNSRAYAERFSGRDYSRVMALNFQDVRLGLRPDQPSVVPQLEHRMIGKPKSLWGGRWEAGASSLVLFRDGNDQDVQRLSADVGWERRDIIGNGLATRLHASGRGDFYTVQDSAAALPGQSEDTQAARGMAVVGGEVSYPLVKRYAASSLVVEPVAGASISPQTDDTNTDIPNEDSIDIEFDANSLFENNRFPGVDRQEDGARVNYGMRAGLHGDAGSYIKGFIGQSHRFDDDVIFPQGSGLENESSDIVGFVSVGHGAAFNADYRFRFDNENLAASRHEVRASGGTEDLRLSTRYIYADAIAGTGFTESREELQLGGSYRLDPNWTATASTITDFGEEPGLRRAALGFAYADECFSFSIDGIRNLTNDAAGESESVIMMRIGLKNIGEFSAPEIAIKSAGQ